MIFLVLVLGTIWWACLGIGLLILPYFWLVFYNAEVSLLDKVIAGVLFAGVECTIIFTIFTIWRRYNDQSTWGITAWLLLPLVVIFLYGAHGWTLSDS